MQTGSSDFLWLEPGSESYLSYLCTQCSSNMPHWVVAVRGQVGAHGRDILPETVNTRAAVSQGSVLAELGPSWESSGSSKSTVGDRKGLSCWG